jgi:hypothetical protein
MHGHKQFTETGWICKDKSSGRPLVSKDIADKSESVRKPTEAKKPVIEISSAQFRRTARKFWKVKTSYLEYTVTRT